MNETTNIILNGKAYQLKPLTRKMQSDVINWCKQRAISELMKNARLSDMPKDLVNSQLTLIQMSQNHVTSNDPLATPYLLYLRAKDFGVTEDEAFSIPDSEYTEEVENIIFENGQNEEADSEKKRDE